MGSYDKEERNRKVEAVEVPATEQIESLIVDLSGQQAMLDKDLAMLYGVETKRLNEQVKRNMERFPERFSFQLTDKETNELVANCDRFRTLKHSNVNPFAFTEQGRIIKRPWQEMICL